MNKRIKLIRERNHLSQEAFGKQLGITKASVSRIESGINNPSEQTLLLICNMYNINEDWLRNGGPESDMLKKEFENDELATYCVDISEGKDPFIADMLLKYKKLSQKHKQAIWEIYEELKKKEEEEA